MAASFLGALPIGMLGLGLLLLIRSTTGSFATAGLVSGAFSVGNAVGLVAQGRLIDVYGQTRVLVVSGLWCPTALSGLLAAATLQAPLSLSTALAVGAGVGLPATTSSLRVLLPRLISDPELRGSAYAVLATQFQIAMVAGPLLVSALVLLGGPALAVLAAAGFAGGGGLIFAASPASRRTRPTAGEPTAVGLPAVGPDGRGGWPGAGMVTLLVGGFGAGLAGGMMTVSVPAVDHVGAALTGLLFAALSAGELLGGLVYGGRTWRLSTPHRLVTGQAAAALGMAALALSTRHPAAMAAALVATGACLAPISIAASALLDTVAPGGSLARAYTMMVAVGLAGVAAGTALGAPLGAATGVRPVLLAAGGVLGVVAWWTATRVGSLIRLS